MARYTLIIRKTNNYPFYERAEEQFETLEAAEKRLDEASKCLMGQCRKGTLQDYNLEIVKERRAK